MSFLNNDALQTFYWVHLTFCPSYACLYLHIFVCTRVYMRACMRACMRVCMRACMPRSAVGLFLFYICCWGFPGCPRQCRMFLLHRKSCSLSPFTVPQSICPPLPSVSIILSNTLSPHKHRCLCPFPSQWRNAKQDQQTSSCDKGFIFPYTWVALCVHLYVVMYVCVSPYHLRVLSHDCRFPIPSTCVVTLRIQS